MLRLCLGKCRARQPNLDIDDFRPCHRCCHLEAARGPPAFLVNDRSGCNPARARPAKFMENGDMKMRTGVRSRAMNVARLAGSARRAAFCYANTTCAARACCASGSFIAECQLAHSWEPFNWKLPTCYQRPNLTLAIIWGSDCAAKPPRSHCSSFLRCSNRCAAWQP
jgi:hypothetical protein